MSISPSSVTLYPGQTQQFTVGFSGVTDQAVTWSMSPQGVGTISSSGLYTAPASIATQEGVSVTATSQADPSVSVTTSLSVQPLSMAIFPASATIYPAQTQQFTASVSGTPNQTVTWSVGSTGAGNIDSTGLYTAPTSVASQQTITVTATSQLDPSVSATATINAVPVGNIVLFSQPILGINGLCGAFTDDNGSVVEPIAIGGSPRVFIVPAGSTQLQLGINDDNFPDNVGTGFQVAVNNEVVNVPPTTMPWAWSTNGLNQLYFFGDQNGTAPVVALTQLSPGTEVSISYLSGSSRAGAPNMFSPSDGDGQLDFITGTRIVNGGYPTRYMTDLEYPIGETIPLALSVTDSMGKPLVGVTVSANIDGANAQQLVATTDPSGTAVLSYSGYNTGTDAISATAVLNGQIIARSPGVSQVTWTSEFNDGPSLGTLSVISTNNQVGSQGYETEYEIVAQDGTGNPLPNLPVTVQVLGANQNTSNFTTDRNGLASGSFVNVNTGLSFIVAYATIGGMPVFSGGTPVEALSSVLLPSSPVAIQGAISSPLIDSVLQRTAPIPITFSDVLNSATLYLIPLESPDTPSISSTVSRTGQTVFDVSQLPGGDYWLLLVGEGPNGDPVNGLIMLTLQ